MEVFGRSVQSAATARSVRDLDVVELWSGVGAVVRAARVVGCSAEPFDLHRAPGRTDSANPKFTENIINPDGFVKALELVQRLRPGGLLWMAPVCSSWVFLRMSQTKRRRRNRCGAPRLSPPLRKPQAVRRSGWARSDTPRYVGDKTNAAVREGNLMADVATFFYLTALMRNVHAVIENPPGSTLFKYGPLADALKNAPKHTATCSHCVFSDAPYGMRFGKKFKMTCTSRWILKLARTCKRPNKKHLFCVKAKYKGGVRKVTGIVDRLRASASYPRRMGEAIVAAWHLAPEIGPASLEVSGRTRSEVSRGHRSTAAGVTSARSWKSPSLTSEPQHKDRSWKKPAL